MNVPSFSRALIQKRLRSHTFDRASKVFSQPEEARVEQKGA